MKFTVSMKTPDALENAIYAALVDNSEGVMDPETGAYDDEEQIIEKKEQIAELCEKWFQYRETVTLEIDTEAETCTVTSEELTDTPNRNELIL